MSLIDDCKLALRVSTSAFNGEISDLIEACKLDLRNSGVVNISEDEYLTKVAIKTYVKANFGMSNPESEKQRSCYESIKTQISLSSLYKGGA